MSLARPWVLWAGLALAGAVVLLHMLRRRPGARAVLPTARFLTPDRRTRFRLAPPGDLLLLALRIALLAAIAAAAAAPRAGDARVDLARLLAIDLGSGMGDARTGALDSASLALDAGAVVVGFDTAAWLLDGGAVDSLRTAGDPAVESDYRAALRGLRVAAEASGARTFDAALVTRLRTGPWRPGLREVRLAAWPAGLRVRSLPGPLPDTASRTDAPAGESAPGPVGESAAEPTGAGGAAPSAVVRLAGSASAARPYLRAALLSLGYGIVDDDGAMPPGLRWAALLANAGAPLPGALADSAAAAGATIARWGAQPPGRTTDAGSRALALLVLGAGADPSDPVVIAAPASASARAPEGGEGVWAVTGSGLVVGVRGRSARGACEARLGVDLADPVLGTTPEFPALVGALVAPCTPPGVATTATGPLGRGALAALQGDTAAIATVASLGLVAGRPLARPLLLLALALLALEVAVGRLARRPRASTGRASIGERDRAA